MYTENVLFLCPGNFVRSILAEAIMNKLGVGRFRAYSAGLSPHRSIHREVRNILKVRGFSVEGLFSKPVELFLKSGAPRLDYVIELGDTRQEPSNIEFPGQPRQTRWAMPDPCQGTLKGATREAVDNAFRDIHMLIGLFLQAAIRADTISRQPAPPSSPMPVAQVA